MVGRSMDPKSVTLRSDSMPFRRYQCTYLVAKVFFPTAHLLSCPKNER